MLKKNKVTENNYLPTEKYLKFLSAAATSLFRVSRRTSEEKTVGRVARRRAKTGTMVTI